MKSPSITPETFRTFDPLAKNFRLTAPNVRDGWESKTLAPSRVRCSRDSDFFDVPELWWRPAGEVRLQAFTKKLQYWLQTQKLPASDEIVDILTGMVAVRVLDGVSLVSILNEMQDAVRGVDVVQIQMLPEEDTSEWLGSLEWRGFRLGALDSDKLAYKCRKAKAAWFEAQSRKVDGVKSIQSPVTKRTLMDWSSVCWNVRSSNIKRFGPSLIEHYHQYCSRVFASAMWSEFEDAWLLPQSLGLHQFDIPAFQRMPGGNMWTILSGIGPSSAHSWVGSTEDEAPIKVLDLDRIAASLTSLSEKLHFNALQKSSLFPLIQSVSRSLVRSTSHLMGGRQDESFLFLVIAIEQVFSQKQNTTQAIVSRTSLVTHLFLQVNFQEAQKKIRSLYDSRSKLVHAGESVTVEGLLDANDLGEAVLRCLIRLACSPRAEEENLHESWLKQLDYLIAGIEAGIPPSDTSLIETGIIDPSNE